MKLKMKCTEVSGANYANLETEDRETQLNGVKFEEGQPPFVVNQEYIVQLTLVE